MLVRAHQTSAAELALTHKQVVIETFLGMEILTAVVWLPLAQSVVPGTRVQVGELDWLVRRTLPPVRRLDHLSPVTLCNVA